MGNGVFSGRTIAVVNDLSVDEQLYLYEKAAQLKKAMLNKEDYSDFQIDDPTLGVYLIFLEDSTRTKESFRNAACFHNLKLNDFNVQSSSFNKKENISDTIKMLFGYSMQSLFIIRSKVEGTCRLLEQNIGAYAQQIGFPKPGFINAGDGKHEHPTQEFLDEFTFLEQKKWNRDEIHLAITGDLFHGRTVHSKADGLRIFKKVKVDLIAPEELQMPESYIQKMKNNGFEIRSFQSIEEYLKQGDIADSWYFTRLQLERMGDTVLDKSEQLRAAVTFSEKYIDKMPEGTKFYHPLPRHSEYPTIPPFLDDMSLNGWDEQSRNGYYTRIIQIAMLGGLLGDDFKGVHKVPVKYDQEFVKETDIASKNKFDYKVGIKPVEDGIVIDHIGKGKNLNQIWTIIDKIRRILHLNQMSSHGVYESASGRHSKGLISLPGKFNLSRKDLKKLGAISPGCTVNFIEHKKVIKKFRIDIPPRIYNFDEISCRNENCISNPEYCENVYPMFFRSSKDTFVCSFCETSHTFEDIWNR